jgi:hypothetical protein
VEILEVKTEDRNGLVHVALMGELDLSTVAKVQDLAIHRNRFKPTVGGMQNGPARRFIDAT